VQPVARELPRVLDDQKSCLLRASDDVMIPRGAQIEIFPLLRQECKCRPVVVLADREKEEMDEELRHSLKGYKIEWHTRSGAPHCSSDLERVAAGQAKNIILLDNNVEVSLRSFPLLERKMGSNQHHCM